MSQDLTGGRQIAIACVIACAFLMQGIDTTLLTIAIPTIAPDLGVSSLMMHFAVTAYLLGLAVFMPVSGWFADRFGSRRVFAAAITVFVLGSVLAGLSPTLSAMVAARLLQGFGGALMTPVGRLIVLRAFGPDRVLDGMTWLTIPVLIGPLLGPLMGAIIVTSFDWRWIFFVNVPLCALTLALTRWLIPYEPAPGAGRFDWGGFALAGLALVLFQLAVEHLGHPLFAGAFGTLFLLGAALAVFQLYRRHARRHPSPALDLRLFRLRPFATGVIAGGIGRVGLNSLAFLLPVMFQLGMGMSPIRAGVYASAAALGAFAAKPLLRRMIRTFGYAAVISCLAVAGSLLLAGFALFDPAMAGLIVAPYVVASGAVKTMHFNAVNTLTYSGVPAPELSRSVATAGVFQQLSMGLGISLGAAFLALVSGGAEALTMRDFSLVFLIMAVIPLLSLPVLARLGQEAGRVAAKAPEPEPARA